MPTLPPTVHERIARCGEQVRLTGLVNSADVELQIGSDPPISFSASGGSRNVAVPPLDADVEVRARQDAGAGFSDWSPAVVVERAAVPPEAAPRLPHSVSICSHCVRVSGAVPGSRIVLRVGNGVVGAGTAGRDGSGCFSVDLVAFGGDPPAAITATMEVCGVESPATSAPLVVTGPMHAPEVLGPLFGCQRVVPLDGVLRGARVRLEESTGWIGTFCSCWERVDVHVGHALTAGESVRAQAYWAGRGDCIGDGPWSDWESVVPPDERIAPTIQSPLVEGDRMLRVTGQIVGGTRLISIELPDGTFEEWGPVPSSEEVEIALAQPLVAGSVVTVTQTLCSVDATSEPVLVQRMPPEVHAPAIVPPLYACGASVQVSNLHPGGLVRLYADDIPIGIGWAGTATSIAVEASPALLKGRKVTATQTVGSVVSGPSRPVEVGFVDELHRPRIVGPVAHGDRHVWVSGLTAGCRAIVTDDGVVIGEHLVAEPLERVPLWSPIGGTVGIEIDLCGRSATGDRHRSIVSPCRRGVFATGSAPIGFPDWQVPATADGVSFTTKMHGVVHFPADPSGDPDRDLRNLPIIVIAHGLWDPTWYDPDTDDYEPVESFRGYDYLGDHLASWGMLVLSISMDDVNTVMLGNMSAGTHAFSRGEIVLRAIDELLGHSVFGDLADGDRIGIMGHSMAGEGVVAAQQLNRDEGRGYAIRGVLSLAPTRWHDDLVVAGTDYLQIYGSMDQLNLQAVGSTAPFAGVRFYDGGERPKSHAWVHGLRHNPFNRRWVATTDFLEGDYADAALPSATHELVARCLAGAFFLRSVVGRVEYAGYMEGLVLPSSLDHVGVHLQHSRDPRTVVDNYGDEDAQAGVPAESLNGTVNTRGLSVGVTPNGALDPIEDLQLVGLPDCSHDTNGVRFAWAKPGATYRSAIDDSIPAPRGAVALRIAQLYDDDVANPPGVDADLFVQLTDVSGRQSVVRLGAAATIPYPDHDLANDDGPDPLAMMRTVVLPIDAFTAAAPELDPGRLVEVALVLSARATGHLFVDDIELWR